MTSPGGVKSLNDHLYRSTLYQPRHVVWYGSVVSTVYVGHPKTRSGLAQVTILIEIFPSLFTIAISRNTNILYEQDQHYITTLQFYKHLHHSYHQHNTISWP